MQAMVTLVFIPFMLVMFAMPVMVAMPTVFFLPIVTLLIGAIALG